LGFPDKANSLITTTFGWQSLGNQAVKQLASCGNLCLIKPQKWVYLSAAMCPHGFREMRQGNGRRSRASPDSIAQDCYACAARITFLYWRPSRFDEASDAHRTGNAHISGSAWSSPLPVDTHSCQSAVVSNRHVRILQPLPQRRATLVVSAATRRPEASGPRL
jgi:hypothetical protein